MPQLDAPISVKTDGPLPSDHVLEALAVLAVSVAQLTAIVDETMRSQSALSTAVLSLSQRLQTVERQLAALWRVDSQNSGGTRS